MSLAVRVIPCLDVDAGRVVKGVNFENLRDAGDPVELALTYGIGMVTQLLAQRGQLELEPLVLVASGRAAAAPVARAAVDLRQPARDLGEVHGPHLRWRGHRAGLG